MSQNTSPTVQAGLAGPLWWRAALIVVAGVLVYGNSLNGPFIFDDHESIVNNQQIRELWNPSVLFPEREVPTAGRPITNVSFAVNFAVGGLDVRLYHAGNIAIHLLCALVLFGIVRRTLELPTLRGELGRSSTQLAFATALIWMLHPLTTEAVDYLTQRTESLMALFYLLTLYAGLRALSARRRTTGWQVVAFLSCALGMGCKESMITVPVVIVLFDRVFVFDSFEQAFRARWRFYAGLAATWMILAALLSTGPRMRSAGFSTGISPWTYILNQSAMLTRYLYLTIWPRALVLNYGWPQQLTLDDVLPYVSFIGLLLLLTVIALRYRPRVGFLGAWFFITLAPASSIVPIATEVGAERRMYLPLAGLVTLVVIGLAWSWKAVGDKVPSLHPKTVPFAAAFLLAGVSAALAAGTVARNREYSSALALARLTLERYPTPVAHHVLGTELLDVGERREAMVHLRQALPGAPRAHFTLGVELFKDQQLDEAIAELRAFVREQPHLVLVVEAHEYMGRAFMLQERWSEAAGEFREILRMAPSHPIAKGLLADALFEEQAFDEAIGLYRAFLETHQNDVGALNHLGIALGSSGKLSEAVLTFQRAVQIDPSDGAAQRNLASALWAEQDFDLALVHARQAVALQPDDAGSHHVLGRILLQVGHVDEAAAQFARSLELDPTLADAREDLRQLQSRSR